MPQAMRVNAGVQAYSSHWHYGTSVCMLRTQTGSVCLLMLILHKHAGDFASKNKIIFIHYRIADYCTTTTVALNGTPTFPGLDIIMTSLIIA